MQIPQIWKSIKVKWLVNNRIFGVSPNTFKGYLDKWLKTIPDTPKIGNYGASVPAESNSLCDQAKQVGQAGDPNCG